MNRVTRIRMKTIAGLAGLALAIPTALIPAAPAAATGDSITSFTAGVGPSLAIGWTGAAGGYIAIAKADSLTALDPCDSADWYAAADEPTNKVGYFLVNGSANPREFYSYEDWNNDAWISVEPSTQYVACLIDGNEDGQGSPFTVTTETGVAPGALPAPTISGVSPSTGSTDGSTRITITGTNFTPGGSSGVTVGGVAATNVTVVTPTSIVATTPVRTAGAADVVVTNSDEQTATSIGGFTYLGPAPEISGVSPSQGSTAGGRLITITGSGFTAGGAFGVTVDGSACASSSWVSATAVTCTTSAHSAGTVNVVVTNGVGQTATSTGGFTYVAPSSTFFTNYAAADGLGGDVIKGVYVSGGTIYAATNGGLSISTDGGNNWVTKTLDNGQYYSDVNGVYAIDGTPDTVYAATEGGGLAISTDGGANFTYKTTDDGLGNNYVVGVYAIDGTPDTIYAATTGGLSISTNGGTSFVNKTTSAGLGDNFVTGVYAVGSTVYAATDNGLSISIDGGDTFTNKTSSDGLGSRYVKDVYAVGSTVYVATYGGVSISDNGGTSFTNYNKDTNDLGSNGVNGVFASGSTIYTGTSAGLSISTNGGTSFSTYTTADGLGTNTVNWVYVSGDTIYAATSGGLSIEAAAAAPTSPGISPSTDSAAGGTSTPTPSASATPIAVPTPTTTASSSASASPTVKAPAGFVPLSAAEKANAQAPVVNAPLSTSVASAPVLTVPAGTAVAPVVSGLPVSTSLRAGVKAPTSTRAKTAFVTFGTTRSNANGRAKVPAFKPSRAGTYTIQLATTNGKAFYLKVQVAAKKASSTSSKPASKPASKVAGKSRG